jgi:hypothetical protein
MKKESPIILFRSTRETKVEMAIAAKYFDVTESRVGVVDRLVIGRYSVLPYYRELERDLKLQSSRLVNSHLEHSYIANFDYYEDIANLTAMTWFQLLQVPDAEAPIIVKGRTNSKKFDWDTLMLAKDKRDAGRIAYELSRDPLIAEQGVIFRRFLNLKILEVGISGTPFSNEWRFFFYGDRLLSYGFYWTTTELRGEMNETGIALAKQAASLIKESASFFVVDIAEGLDGQWWVIEVNDGQMSGLSDNDPEVLYKELASAMAESESE